MDEHPNDLLPAFVLDALDDETMRHVARHLRGCSLCRAEAETFRAVVELLPYSIPAHTPLPRVKRQLFARISAARETDGVAQVLPERAPAFHAPLGGRRDSQPRTAAAPPRPVRWAQLALVLAVGLVLVLSAMMVDAQRRLSTAELALQRSQQALDSLQKRLSEQQQIVAFVSDPQAAHALLASQHLRATGQFVMHAGDARAVLLLHGLQPPPPGKTYQFWLATAAQAYPSRTFTVGSSGTAELLLQAPAPLAQLTQVMITVEPEGGSATPSDDIVLSASL